MVPITNRESGSSAQALGANEAAPRSWPTTTTKKAGEAKTAGLKTQDLRTLDWSTVAALVLAPGVPLTPPDAALERGARA